MSQVLELYHHGKALSAGEGESSLMIERLEVSEDLLDSPVSSHNHLPCRAEMPSEDYEQLLLKVGT